MMQKKLTRLHTLTKIVNIILWLIYNVCVCVQVYIYIYIICYHKKFDMLKLSSDHVMVLVENLQQHSIGHKLISNRHRPKQSISQSTIILPLFIHQMMPHPSCPLLFAIHTQSSPALFFSLLSTWCGELSSQFLARRKLCKTSGFWSKRPGIKPTSCHCVSQSQFYLI